MRSNRSVQFPCRSTRAPRFSGNFSGELVGVAGINRIVEILIGGFRRLNGASVIAIPQQEGSEAIARQPLRPCPRCRWSGQRVCRRHPGVELEQARRIIALEIVVTEDANSSPTFRVWFPMISESIGVKAVSVVGCADAAAGTLCAP